MANNKYQVDEVISLQKNDLLGSSIYLEPLKDLVEEQLNSSRVETIAVSGEWGIGKSSLVNSVKDSLQYSSIKFIEYNAWKYNNDDFRKSFLLNAVPEKNKDKYQAELSTKTVTKNYSLNKPGLLKNIKAFLCIVFASIIIYLCLNFFINSSEGDNNLLIDIINFIYKIFVLALISNIINRIINGLFSEETTLTEVEFTAKTFSDRFEKIMSENKDESVVFVIDDLDRCEPEQLLEILETIHGFLKIKSDKISNYIFLIPIDKSKLYSILIQSKGYEYESCEQYFNKIFDIEFAMKPIDSYNMFDMLAKLNEDSELKLSTSSISLLADFLVKTPRDAKMYMNELNSRIMIINLQKLNKYILPDSLEEKEIVKIFIIEKRWNYLYTMMLQDWTLDLANKIFVKMEITDDDIEEEDIYNITTFARHSRDVKIKSLLSYAYIKERTIDPLLRTDILTGTYKCKCESNENLERDIEAIDFCYKEYILKRNQKGQYIINVVKSFILLMCNPLYKDKHKRNSEIVLSEDLANEVYECGYNSDPDYLTNFEQFFETIIQLGEIKSKNSWLEKFLSGFYKNQIKYSDDNFGVMLIEAKRKTEISQKLSLQVITNLIENDQFKINFDKIAENHNISEEGRNELISLLIKKKQLYAIAQISDKGTRNIERLVEAKDEISDILLELPVFTNRNNVWEGVLLNEFSMIMRMINNLRNKNDLFESIINKFLENASFLSKLQSIFDEYKESKEEIFEFLECMADCISDINNNDLELSVKYGYFLLDKQEPEKEISTQLDEIYKSFIQKIQYPDSLYVCYRTFIEKFDNEVALNLFIQQLNQSEPDSYRDIIFKTFDKDQNPINSIEINETRYGDNLHINTKATKEILLNNLEKLDIAIIREIVEHLKFDEIYDFQMIDFLVKEKKVAKNDPIHAVIIDKIESGDQFMQSVDKISKKTFANEYRIKFKEIIDKMDNVTGLMEIAEKTNKKLNMKDKEYIRDNVLEKYPSYVDEFKTILFNKVG
ncbi:P-loop NTPase fold protein [Erysipelothrix rhusiopathiae]|nr:P-loop NTPase fold protein [Erysipelothrix rhusiopathiae]MDE8049114.1 P-loop NTPase fold protein [Erysipelothrix rhusiopathiae]MDE8058348.1 P-loop NTPase fold protein [Erysipelothrix rhusiopathiae]MDE8067084.1 P-loop NTPase fold protein [Erysipelothrix rhusiopathiae]MDE8076401.1 P-loop NTPase fold protein [Erysipelothrix rhusiopathiae]